MPWMAWLPAMQEHAGDAMDGMVASNAGAVAGDAMDGMAA